MIILEIYSFFITWCWLCMINPQWFELSISRTIFKVPTMFEPLKFDCICFYFLCLIFLYKYFDFFSCRITLIPTFIYILKLTSLQYLYISTFYVWFGVILFLCFSVLWALRLPPLGKRELILELFVRLFDLRLFGFVCFAFLLESGKGCGLWLWHSLDLTLIYFDCSFVLCQAGFKS